ncbi:MAG: TlpA family protein disulfide reductase [Thermoleophilaceae bacterium]
MRAAALRKPGALAVSLLAAGLIALLGYGVIASQPDHELDRAAAAGKRESAPSLTLPRLDGRGSGSLDSYRGRVVLVNFWASWCDPCKQEAPLLERWQRRIAPRGGTVLGVDTLDVTGDARSFAARYGLTYPMLRDGDGERNKAFGVVGYPETVVVDRRGRVAETVRGQVDESFLERVVPPLLRERS